MLIDTPLPPCPASGAESPPSWAAAVRVAGRGPLRARAGRSGVPIVLEGGLGASSVGWSRVAAELAGVASVLRYDRPGLGAGAPAAGRGRGLGALADDLIAVLEDTRVSGPAVLVGHSWGATIVRLVAHRRPELVAGLVLLEPVPDRWLLRWGRVLRPAGTVIYLALRAAAASGLITLLARTGPARRWFTGRRGALPDGVRAQLFAEVCRPAHHAAGQREFAGMATGSRAELSALRPDLPVPYPVLVVTGSTGSGPARRLRARLTAAHAELAEAYGGDHVILAAGGHLLPRENPVGVAHLVATMCRPAAAAAPAVGERR